MECNPVSTSFVQAIDSKSLELPHILMELAPDVSNRFHQHNPSSRYVPQRFSKRTGQQVTEMSLDTRTSVLICTIVALPSLQGAQPDLSLMAEPAGRESTSGHPIKLRTEHQSVDICP